MDDFDPNTNDDFDIRDRIPKTDPCSAISVIAHYIEKIWPITARRQPTHLSMNSIEFRRIENISHAFDILLQARTRIGSQVEVPGDVLAPFQKDLLTSDCHTFATKMMPLEARKYASNAAKREGVDFFDESEPEPTFELTVDEKEYALSLVSQLRDLVSEASFHDDVKHVLRLRLNQIENELQRQVGRTFTVSGILKSFVDVANYKPEGGKSGYEMTRGILEVVFKKSKNIKQIECEQQKRIEDMRDHDGADDGLESAYSAEEATCN